MIEEEAEGLSVEFECEWDDNGSVTTLEIITDAASVSVPISDPFDIKRWENLFESLGIKVINEEDEP